MPTVEAFEVCIPDLKEQQRIVCSLNEQIAAVERARVTATAQLKAAKSLPSAYLRRLFSESADIQWPRICLGDIAVRITDGTHQPPPFTSTGVPFLFVRNIVAGRIDFNVEKYVSEETYEELVRGCRPERGDLLYSAVGSFGVAVVVDTDRSFTFQRHIAHTKLRRDLADARFVASYLNSPEGRRRSEAAAFGGAQRTVTLGALAKFEIPMPELDAQIRAVEILSGQMSAAEQIRVAVEEKMASIGALAVALLRRAFSGEL
jgi:type I restriction enzyme S subunit